MHTNRYAGSTCVVTMGEEIVYRLFVRFVVIALIAVGAGLLSPAAPASAGACPPGWIGNPGQLC